MNHHPTDEERQAWLADEHVGPLGDDEAADLPLLAELLADPATWAEPRAGLEDDVVRAVAAGTRDAPAVASPRSAADAHHAPSRRRRFTVSIAAAAAVLIIGVGAVVVAQRGNGADFKAQLAATALAPRAAGSVTMTRNDAGFRIVLDTRDLPVLPAGEYYQAWLKNAANTLVPIGTFSSSDGRVTMWSGVSPAEFHSVSVTIEATDNNQGSSGRRVLTGDVHPE